MWIVAFMIEHTSKIIDTALDIPDVIKLLVLIRQGWVYIKSIFKINLGKFRLK